MNLDKLKAEFNAKVSNLKTEMLCEIIVSTNERQEIEIPFIREAVMSELELRNKAAFDKWIDCQEVELVKNPTSFFVH